MVGFDDGNFSRGVTRIAVAQLCETIGFEGFEDSALDSLSDLAIRYVSDLAKSAEFNANLAGRTQCNVFDIIKVLQDIGLSQSPSDEDGNECVLSSSIVREIKKYVGSSDEVPFAQPVPRYPLLRDSKPIPSFLQMDETPSSKHIPPWLPAFPDHHTYLRTPVWNERVSDPRADKIDLSRQNRKAERSLLSLQKRLVSCTEEAADVSIPEEPDEAGFEKIETHTSEDSTSQDRKVLNDGQSVKLFNVEDTKKKSSLLETFAPAIEAMVDGLDSGSDNERIEVPVKRVSPFLELKSGGRLFGDLFDLKIRNKAPGKPVHCFGREDERDDKKRRVEYILRQAMENQHELSQL